MKLFDDYFDEMDLTEEQKKDRKMLADIMLTSFLYLFAYAKRISDSPDALIRLSVMTKTELLRVIPDFISKHGGIVTENDTYIQNYINNVSENTSKTTINNIEDDYFTSYDRAWISAGTESNSVENYVDYVEAVQMGKTRKKWHSIIDKKTRKTHVKIDGETIPIADYFRVGDSYMRFPHDISLDPAPKEIINCRCSVEYL